MQLLSLSRDEMQSQRPRSTAPAVDYDDDDETIEHSHCQWTALSLLLSCIIGECRAFNALEITRTVSLSDTYIWR